jgi:hypothetical protein
MLITLQQRPIQVEEMLSIAVLIAADVLFFVLIGL